jgi:hypothetical protein
VSGANRPRGLEAGPNLTPLRMLGMQVLRDVARGSVDGGRRRLRTTVCHFMTRSGGYYVVVGSNSASISSCSMLIY